MQLLCFAMVHVLIVLYTVITSSEEATRIVIMLMLSVLVHQPILHLLFFNETFIGRETW